MNRKLLFFILLIISLSAFAQNRDVDIANATPDISFRDLDLNYYNLNGKVKLVKNIVHESIEKFGEITKGKIISPLLFGADEENFKSEFNNNGLMTQFYRFDEDGKTNYNIAYRYDSKNNLIEIKQVNSNEITTYLERNDYNSKNLRVTTYCQYWEKDESFIEYEYDEFLKIIRKVVDNGKSREGYEFSYYYKNSQVYEIIMITNNGTSKSKKKISYSNNNISLIEELNEENEVFKTVKFKYDERSNLINKSVWERNRAKNLESIFKYDDKNNLIEEISNSYTIKFKYTYDKNKNWISKIKYVDGIPQYIISRELIYYN